MADQAPIVLHCVCCRKEWPGQMLAGFQVWNFDQMPCQCHAPFRSTAASLVSPLSEQDARFLKTLRIEP